MKGILFKPYLLPAVMDGTKTMTRRVMKPQPTASKSVEGAYDFKVMRGDKLIAAGNNLLPAHLGSSFFGMLDFSRYQPGEVVYVKEAWMKNTIPTGWPYWYKLGANVDFTNPEYEKWKSPMFMPEAAARTFLKITDVRAERICDISEEDCFAEGIYPPYKHIGPHKSPHDPELNFDGPHEAFFALIWSVNPGIDLNTWVWVYTFERVGRPDR